MTVSIYEWISSAPGAIPFPQFIFKKLEVGEVVSSTTVLAYRTFQDSPNKTKNKATHILVITVKDTPIRTPLLPVDGTKVVIGEDGTVQTDIDAANPEEDE